MSNVTMQYASGAQLAGWLSLAAFFIPILYPFAVIAGIIGLKQIHESYFLKGAEYCWIGIIWGSFGTLGLLMIVLVFASIGR